MSRGVHRNREWSIGNPSARVNRAPAVTPARTCSALRHEVLVPDVCFANF